MHISIGLVLLFWIGYIINGISNASNSSPSLKSTENSRYLKDIIDRMKKEELTKSKLIDSTKNQSHS